MPLQTWFKADNLHDVGIFWKHRTVRPPPYSTPPPPRCPSSAIGRTDSLPGFVTKRSFQVSQQPFQLQPSPPQRRSAVVLFLFSAADGPDAGWPSPRRPPTNRSAPAAATASASAGSKGNCGDEKSSVDGQRATRKGRTPTYSALILSTGVMLFQATNLISPNGIVTSSKMTSPPPPTTMSSRVNSFAMTSIIAASPEHQKSPPQASSKTEHI